LHLNVRQQMKRTATGFHPATAHSLNIGSQTEKMKTFTTSFLISIFFILHQNVSFPQQTENWLEMNEPINYAKLYLHTDREFYFQGDSIWFKAYYLNGQTQHFIPGFFNIYADLVDKNGQTIQSQVLPMANGVTSGNITISDSLEPGNYLLRAFTDFQKNWGEYAFFYKTLKISKIKNSFELTSDSITMGKKEKPEIDVAFLPEGGFLLEKQVNIVGVKAVDKNGTSISIQGEILDSKGELAARFCTEYKGMGKFSFIPLAGEIYTVNIDGHPDHLYEFSSIQKEGIKLEFIGEEKDNLWFRVTTNSKLFQGENYYFAIMHRGKVLFYQKFVQQGKSTKITLNQSDLQAGINRLILLDEQLKPISERPFFSKNFEINDVEIRLNQNQYETRSNVQLEIFDEEICDGSYSSLSVAIVDENAVGNNGPALNILSWLLIDSELKGNIESPADYFNDDKNISSENKLNLLMLTQGWNRYLWNSILEKDTPSVFKEVEGISIKGSVTKELNKKPVVNGEIVIKIFNDDFYTTAEGKTDENGRFSFDSIFFTDSAVVFIQARNKKGKLYTAIVLDPVFEKSPGVPESYLPAKKIFSDFPIQLYRQKYFNEMALNDFILESGSILLDEVIVKGEKIEKYDGHFRIYGEAHTSFKITDLDIFYPNVLSYLQGRVPGVQISGDNVIIRGVGSFDQSSEPLFLINGMPVSKESFLEIPMSVIDKVEVLKSPDKTAIFGMRGSNGVIAIFTKQGMDMGYNDTYTPGTLSEKIAGYSSYREFYSPKYTPENLDSERPDHRITLYWNPNIITELGKASISFFTSDNISHFKVFVEGVTINGEICLGTSEFVVNMDHSNYQ